LNCITDRGIDGWKKDEGHRETQSYIQFGLMNQYGIIEDLLGVQQ